MTTTAETAAPPAGSPTAAERAAHELVARRYRLIEEADRPEVWIGLRPQRDVAEDVARALAARAAGEHLPLAGTLFAVKNNIDVAGLPTTAACPAFGYEPERDAVVVRRLKEAGAVVLGSTNLDQFATGLVGTRSPYGAVRHAEDPARISGGSSSGSGVAVALGFADFALGTDTAGSGRVPAALHGLYGVKPTKGLVPSTGVVPACRSQDVVTTMARELRLARLAADVMAGVDDGDARSRPPAAPRPSRLDRVVGRAVPEQLGELAPGWAEAYTAAVRQLEERGFRAVPVDIEPFLSAATLLYDGAFVAERWTAVGAFVDAHPQDVDPTVGRIVRAAEEIPAHRVFADQEFLDGCARLARQVFGALDALVLPTTTSHPTLAEVAADPVGANSRMGRFTNFVNLLDLSALAVPAGRVDGLPFGVQLVGDTFQDDRLVDVAREGGFDGR
ncbi:allophanate hydrolase [uncultured Kocuria sp.]|uniref:allophanate hydrolase n=1 Tax=uncultured Kocuria sp. TaxID=259305 RepID=UPI002609F11B|nr:allophanate hydrolase [uncultured Kocuria sp.]